MAKIHIERSYIESYDDDDSHKILVHIKESNNHTLVGKVELDRDVSWIHLKTADNGDLLINNSAGMEDNKWNHITREIVGDTYE